MIEPNQAYLFDFHNACRDFRTRAGVEKFLLQLEIEETDWTELGSVPRDAIGATTLDWPECGQHIRIGYEGCKRLHRNRQIGELFLLELVVSEDDWLKLRALPFAEIGTVALLWTARLEAETGKVLPMKHTRKEKPAKGEYGAFWQQLWDFQNRPDVRQWLDYNGQDEVEAKRLLCAQFNVTSRTFISPDALLATLREQSDTMAGAMIAVERAKARIQARAMGVTV